MKKANTLTAVCTIVLATAGLAAAQGMPPMPKPGPEHALFKDVAGTWDAKVESFMVPGAPASVSSGTETARVACGGMCLLTEFKGSFVMGPPKAPPTPFDGHGTETYDQGKKKYVGSWTDSMSTGLSVTESTYDPATKTLKGWMEGPDMTGKVEKMRSTTTMKDANTRVMEMYNMGPDGKESLGMRITYTRKK
jgi:uncharacterized protein DUF1579